MPGMRFKLSLSLFVSGRTPLALRWIHDMHVSQLQLVYLYIYIYILHLVRRIRGEVSSRREKYLSLINTRKGEKDEIALWNHCV